jgi:hypothetical protein
MRRGVREARTVEEPHGAVANSGCAAGQDDDFVSEDGEERGVEFEVCHSAN